MSEVNPVNPARSHARLWVLTAAALALAIALPLLVKVATNRAQADEAPGPSLLANLSGGPIAGETPRGVTAFYPGGPNFGAHLIVNIDDVNLPANTHLNVFLNADNIGVITLDNHQHGTLFLPHAPQDPPPVVNDGDVMSIGPADVPGGDTEVLHGTFGPAPTPTPMPSRSPFPTQSPHGTPNHSPFPSPTHNPFPTPTPHPSHSPFASPSPHGTPVPPVHLFAPLTGPAIDGVIPRGIGQYQSWMQMRGLDVYVSFVNLPEGTSLGVTVAGTSVGSITLHNHAGALHLSTGHGDDVPVVAVGDLLNVTNGGTGNSVVLSGVFTDTPPPMPTPPPHATPSPHGTPNGTPTPHPSPGPAHAFAANLNGEQVVPPVTTDAHGRGFIMLNRDETEINVFVGYRHLSSDVTDVTINGPAEPGSNGPVIFTLTNPPVPGETLPFQTFPVTTEQITQLRANLWYFNIATVDNPDGEIRGQIRSVNHRDDFDGDGLSEVSVMRESETGTYTWYILNSSDNAMTVSQAGNSGDINVQGDYDGDGTADVATFTPSSGMWRLQLSATGQPANYQWGTNGDVPLVGDYDSDGINDLAVFRPSNGNWYIRRSIDGAMMAIHWGMSGDKPVSGDFDGDGRNDLAVFRPASGDWYILRSSDSGMTAMHWGMNGDRPVAGDFDGDGRSDVAVFRPSEGNWYAYRSSDNGFLAMHFGAAGDIPVPCEFDGDGTTDIAVFRPSEGNWYILRSSDNSMSAFHFGISTDRPITTAYAPQ